MDEATQVARRARKTERIFRALFIHRNGLPVREIISHAYDGEANGGALWDISSVGVLIYRLNRDHLEPLGFKIVSDPPRGGRGAKRRLVKL